MDITKCTGINCPLKEKCKRYGNINLSKNQNMIPAPFVIDKGMFRCEMFWGDQSQLLLEQLIGIITQKK